MSETNTNGHAKDRLGKAQRRLKTLALKQQLAEARIRLARAERKAKAEELKTAHWWPQEANPGRQQLHENLSRKRDQQTQLLEVKAAGKDISETALWGEWVGGYQDMLDRFRSPDGLLLSAISIAADRRYGAYWPFFRTWQELALLRGAARILYQTSALARGAVQGLISYIIGDGFSYRVVERPGAPQGLQTAAQEILDENRDLNDWPALEAECLRRDVRDGEWFLRDFPQPNGLTYTRTIGPEQLIQPADSTLEEWSFGKQNPIGDAHDVQTVLAYNVCYDGNNTTGIVVPAENVIEHTANVDRDVKRGIPDLSYDTYDFLKVAGRLIENMGEGSAIQAAVSEIRQWEGPVTGDQASDFVDANADYTVPNPWTGTSESVRQVRPGEVRDIPKGMQYVPPPFTQGSPIFIQVEQAVLRAVAVTWNAPEWLTSGDSSNNSYASSLTAESPFIKTGQHKQNTVYKPRFLTAKWRVLRNYCRARGGIVVNGQKYDFAALRKYLDIQCEPPSMETRNKLDEAQANATRIEGGWKSRQTVASEENLDWVNEKRNMKEYAEEFPDQAPPAAGGGKAGPEVPKPPHPLTEGKDTEKTAAEEDPDAFAEMTADILYGVFGDKALEFLEAPADSEVSECRLLEAWDASHHPRGKNGRFIGKGSSEAISTAKEAIGKALKGEKGSAGAGSIMSHMNLLTVKQLKEVHKEHGVKAPGKLRDQLVEAIREKLEGAEKPEHKIDKVKDKFWGTAYKVGDKEFISREKAEKYVAGEKAGHSPENTEWWYNASHEDRKEWAENHVPGWLSKSSREQGDWFRETNGDNINAKRKMDAERLAAERAQMAKEAHEHEQKTKAANKAARTYKPKREYKPGTFKVNLGGNEPPGEAEGIGDKGLYIRKGEGGWVVSHTPSGSRVSSPYPSRGAALMAMDRLNDLGTDWSKPANEIQHPHFAHLKQALDLTEPMPGKAHPTTEGIDREHGAGSSALTVARAAVRLLEGVADANAH